MATNWQVGDCIQNRWEIRKILRGGMGIVYVVFDYEVSEVIALKTFQDKVFARNPFIASRFEQEALSWVNLGLHLNIVFALDVVIIEEKPFLALEYVDGGDLGSWIDKQPLTKRGAQIVEFAIQFCDGMVHARLKGIKAHRDIKPENCLITSDNWLKITDFGLAKIFDDVATSDGGERRNSESCEDNSIWGKLISRWQAPNERAVEVPFLHRPKGAPTRTGVGAGTPTHMAPEQFDDAKHVDVRADIYSFGVMLHQMVTGKLPFKGRTRQEFERLHKTQSLPEFETQNVGLKTLIQQCLAKDPAERFADFSEVRELLGDIYKQQTSKSARPLLIGEADDYLYWSIKGNSSKVLGHLEEALDCYDRALALNPQDASCWSGKGFVLDELGRSEEALDCYDQALVLNSLDADTWYSKGVAFSHLGQWEESLICYDNALSINSKDAGSLSNKGHALKALGRLDESLACYDQSLALHPQDVVIWSNKGATLEAMGRHEEALDCHNRALTLNPQDAISWYNKGNSLVALGYSEDALNCYSHALTLNPQHASSWYNQGVIWAKDFHRYPEAIVCFEKARQLGNQQAEQSIRRCQQLMSSK